MSTTDGWLKLNFANCVILDRQTRSCSSIPGTVYSCGTRRETAVSLVSREKKKEVRNRGSVRFITTKARFCTVYQ